MIILTPEYKVHVAIIDEQHQELIDLINFLETVDKASHTTETIENALNFLAEYISKHFSDEQDLMLECGYPDYEWHKNWHQSYILKYNTLLEEYFENGITEKFAYILEEFVEKWFARHIRNVDTNLGKFIIEYNREKKL